MNAIIIVKKKIRRKIGLGMFNDRLFMRIHRQGVPVYRFAGLPLSANGAA